MFGFASELTPVPGDQYVQPNIVINCQNEITYWKMVESSLIRKNFSV